MRSVIIFFILFSLKGVKIWAVRGQTHNYKIGGLFPDEKSISKQENGLNFAENAFKFAADFSDSKGVNLIPVVKHIGESNDALAAENSVCGMLESSVISIFGPQIGRSSPIVQSICDTKEIPHIQARYYPIQHRGSCLVNLYPHPTALSKAFTDVIKEWEWKSFVLIYENNESLIKVSDLLKPENNGGAIIKMFQLNATNDFRKMFREIIMSKECNIFVECSNEKLPHVLQQAQQVGLMISRYNYIIACLDMHIMDMEPYKYSGANITGFRLLNPERPIIRETLAKWAEKDPFFNVSAEKLPVEAALMYDAVRLFKKSLDHLTTNPNKNKNDRAFLANINVPDCYSSDSWHYGFTVINHMKIMEMEGLTGLIKFDHEGYRTNLQLQIIELREEGITEKGSWNTTEGVTITNVYKPEIANVRDLKNTTFTVIISLTKPFGMLKPLSTTLKGNNRYEGYSVDLIQHLSELSGFKYEFIIQENGESGSPKILPNKKQVWDGMIGAVKDRRADLAVADITITSSRQKVVEFSDPFMNLGISILFTKPTNKLPSLFSFLSPFGTEVWLLVLTAYIAVSLQFFIMARLSPYEWKASEDEPDELINQFTLSNAFWFTIGALMQQGSDIAPVSPSTRMAAGIWWFFSLIMVSSYTANLAAFLTVENPVSPFEDLKGLSEQTEISYGCKPRGSTYNFFKDSTNPVDRKIFEHMEKNEKDMLKPDEGIARVEEGKYAYIMESSFIEYESERRCNLTQIGDLLDNKNYGIAMRKGEWYVNQISKDVLTLQARGVLNTLKRKWWKEKYAKNCATDEKNGANQLDIANIGGVFVVLAGGIAVAFLVMSFEWFSHLSSIAKEENIPPKEEFIRELKSILKCQSVKAAQADNGSSLEMDGPLGLPNGYANKNKYGVTE